MENVPFFNKQAIILGVVALLLNLFFLYMNYNSIYCDGYKHLHGRIAHNLLVYGSSKVSPLQRWNTFDESNTVKEIEGLSHYEFEKDSLFSNKIRGRIR